MFINNKIESALSDITGGHIWPSVCPLEDTPKKYIVYNPEYDSMRDFGDSAAHACVHYMQIHWFAYGGKKAVNYVQARSDIRRELIAAGFIVTSIDYIYEQTSGYTHLIFSAYIEEDDFNG